ncbi:hypothetical protein J6TS1_27060 [Siminovitchia terrae]|uniref:Uncharacterized protein n=1 Tax=Siminovitchia terrae TaxID=1914933 RepID=A0ABQ4KYZ9_SIMTE|nr:CDP-glycerol glycerophosphotransferase family protein [Siminovitchia terrae]GIN96836.1 hypothetical protein J6TS1_27060 [Siminovitchia terrae]
MGKNSLLLNSTTEEQQLVHFELIEQLVYLTFPTSLFEKKESVSFFCKKRKEQKRFFLDHIMEKSTFGTHVTIELEQFKLYFHEKSRLDLYMQFKNEEHSGVYKVCMKQIEKSKNKRYLGLKPLKEEFYISPYVNIKGQISFVINTAEKIKGEIFEGDAALKKVSYKKGVLKFKVELLTQETVSIRNVILKHRRGIDSIVIEVKPENIKGNILFVQIDILNYQFQLQQFYWDIYVEIETNELDSVLLRVKNYGLWNKYKLQYLSEMLTYEDAEGNILVPYITASEDFSLNYRKKGEYEEKKYKYNEYIAFLFYMLFGFWFLKSNIWLIHEKYSETAQDNSFSFFKYCFKHYPQKKVYFVIKKESKDYSHVLPYKKRVVHFMSVKHLFLLLVAKRIVSSEAKGHGFAWRVSQGLIKPRLNQKKFIFLQHGVLGLKKIDNTFKANGFNHADLFVASSDFEKEIIHEYLGYPYKNIVTTGLARWDELENVNRNNRKEILCMPTWRNWLEEVDEDEFLQSEYYQRYYELITSSKLREFLVEHDLYLNFYLHPKFIQFANLFDSLDDHIRIIQFGEETVSQLIKNSTMLITDYSSVAWEYYYLDKPVLFFQFDRDKYEELQGSYMNLETDLFGNSSSNIDALIDSMRTTVDHKMGLDEKSINLKQQYFKHVDNNNCARIFQEIKKNEVSSSLKEELMYSLRRSPLLRTVWKKLKRRFS